MVKWISWKRLFTGLLALVVLSGLSACGDNRDSLTERMHETTSKQELDQSNSEIRQHWKKRDTHPVSGFSGEPFYVLDRKEQIEKYPCTNCHTESFDVRKSRKQPKQAHWNIDVDHGLSDSRRNFNCATCHGMETPNELSGPTGQSYSLTESYRQCGTCHQQQLTDWAGGAHGKRHDYWKGSRVIYNCADCHDPHDPSIEQRWPVTYPGIPRSGKGLDQ